MPDWRRHCRVALSVGLAALVGAAAAFASDDRLVTSPDPTGLNIAYEASPPYFEIGQDKVTGLFAERIRAALAAARIDAAWLELSYNRSQRSIKDGEVPICTVSSLRDHVPEGSRFTASIGWYPRSSIAILEETRPLFERHATIADILNDPGLRGGFINNAQYGDLMPLIELGADRHLFIGGTDVDLANLVVRKRVQFTMINEDQVIYYRKAHAEAAGLVSYYPAGMRAERPIHLLCNAAVSDDLFGRLDSALKSAAP